MILSDVVKYRDFDKWHHKLGVRRRHVCRVEISGGSQRRMMSTGFLVGPDIVLTTHHSIISPTKNKATLHPGDIRFRFDYLSQDKDNEPSGHEFSAADADWLLAEADDLDYALIRLNGSPGLEMLLEPGDERKQTIRGWITLLETEYRFRLGEPLIILQHPQGYPLQIAFSADAVIKIDPSGSRVVYNVDTSPGSSGAPCFNLDLDLIALHQGSASDLRANRGITMNAVFQSLQQCGLAHLVTRKPADVTTLSPPMVPLRVSFAPDPAVLARIAVGENDTTEFKQTALRNLKSGEADEGVKSKIVRAVAGFMNSAGGVLMIGVADDGGIVGIEEDYKVANRQKPGWDSYQLFLQNLLSTSFSVPDSRRFYTIRRYAIEGKDICYIVVAEAEEVVYVKKHLFVRYGNQTPELFGPDVVSFAERRRKPRADASDSE